MSKRIEDSIQADVCGLLRAHKKAGHLEFYAVRNEGKRSLWEQSQILRMGLRSGVPDLVVLLPGGRSLYWELKAPKGTLSENQKKWRAWLTDNGFAWALVRSVDDAVAALSSAGIPAVTAEAE